MHPKGSIYDVEARQDVFRRYSMSPFGEVGLDSKRLLLQWVVSGSTSGSVPRAGDEAAAGGAPATDLVT